MIIDESIAMDNSYNLIMGYDLISSRKDRYFIHNPSAEVTVEDVRRLYNHYKSKHDWGKCVKLQALLVKLTYFNGIKRLSKDNS